VTPPRASIGWISGSTGSDSGIGDGEGLADELTSFVGDATFDAPTGDG
jgi:hypothetical protein